MNTRRNRTAILLSCTIALGALSPAFAGTDGDKHFKMMDANSDGKVSRAEHAAGAKKMFVLCDANQDGIVTASEMDAGMAAQGEKLGADDKTSAEKIQMIDENGDGKLTAAEHASGTEKMFGKMDKNSDGFLSKEECDEALKMMKKHKATG